jgi:hypothetical protein
MFGFMMKLSKQKGPAHGFAAMRSHAFRRRSGDRLGRTGNCFCGAALQNLGIKIHEQWGPWLLGSRVIRCQTEGGQAVLLAILVNGFASGWGRTCFIADASAVRVLKQVHRRHGRLYDRRKQEYQQENAGDACVTVSA